MKILVVFPGQLYPIQGMSQVRVVNQINAFAREHEIIFTDFVSKPEQMKLSQENLAGTGITYQPIKSLNYGKSKLFRALYLLYRKFIYTFSVLSMEEIAISSKSIQTQILNLASENKVDAVLIHYWFVGIIFKQLPQKTLKIIDTHYVVEEVIEHQDKCIIPLLKRIGFKAELNHSLKLQRQYFLQSDLIVVNSAKQEVMIHEWDRNVQVNVTINGQDLSRFLHYQDVQASPNCILFYGALANEFNRLALERILSGILPRMRKSIPDLKLYVVGNNPPQDILSKYNLNNIIVTGHVDDIMPYITLGQVLLLPLETGSGFRGRIVEVMSLGVPIVGTENALQSVDFVDGKQGYLGESDQEIADKALLIVSDPSLRDKMSQACREHAIANFSLEQTFGKLSQFLIELKSAKRK